MFTADILDCSVVGFDFEWELLESGAMFMGDPITLPMLTTTSTLELRSFPNKRGSQSSQATILVHHHLNFDINGDGCNTLDDLWTLFPFWNESYINDPNDDGLMSILDFMYINTDDAIPCP